MHDERLCIGEESNLERAWNQEPSPTVELSKVRTVWWDVDKYDFVSLEQGKLTLRRKDDEDESKSDYRN